MAKKDRLPWFPFYAKDWLDAKVLSMTLEEQGAYIRILAHMWADSKDQCSITKDPKSLSRLLGITVKKMKKFVESWQQSETNLFDESEPNRYRSIKLLQIKADASNLSHVRSLAGKIGARKRWNKSKNDKQKPTHSDNKTMTNDVAKDSYNTYNSKHNTKEEREEGIPSHLIEMIDLARKAKIPNRLETLIKYLDAWIVRVGETEVKDILLLSEIRGLNIIQLEDQYFSQKVRSEPSDISAMIKDALKKPITGS